MDSLWKINADIEALFEQGFDENSIDAETGEIDNEKVTAAFDALMLDRKEKMRNATYYIKNIENYIADSKEAEKAMAERRRSKEKRAEWLKQYLLDNMLKFGDKKIEEVDFCLSYRVSKGIDITDETAIPDEYKKIVVEAKPDKAKIKDALAAGKEVAGAQIYEKKNLQIK